MERAEKRAELCAKLVITTNHGAPGTSQKNGGCGEEWSGRHGYKTIACQEEETKEKEIFFVALCTTAAALCSPEKLNQARFD